MYIYKSVGMKNTVLGWFEKHIIRVFHLDCYKKKDDDYF